jgi:hypothetical protein
MAKISAFQELKRVFLSDKRKITQQYLPNFV